MDAPKRRHRSRRLSVTWRLMIGYVVLLTLVLAGIGIQSQVIFNHRLKQELDNDLQEELPEFTNAVDNRPPGTTLPDFSANYLDTHLRPKGHALIIGISPAGSAPAGTPPTVHVSPGGDAVAASAQVQEWMAHPPSTTVIRTLALDGSSHRVLAAPIERSGVVVGTLVAAADLTDLNRDMRSQLGLFLAGGIAALIAAAIGGYLLLRRVLRMISDVTTTAEDISREDLTRRLTYDGPDDEVGRLATTVNSMLDRVESAFEGQSRLLADVSHQLRTPLTVIRGHLEVLVRHPADQQEVTETAAIVIDEVEQLALMVDRLVLLGQSLEPDFLDEAPVSLRALMNEVHEAAGYLAPRHWLLEAGPEVMVTVDRVKLRGALLNLLDNAVKATTPDDTVTLSARLEGAELLLEVTDTGVGIPTDEQEAVFGRFTRGTTRARYRGTGLGLAIVKVVADAHGGRVELDSEPGRGSRIAIVLPQQRVSRIDAGVGAS